MRTAKVNESRPRQCIATALLAPTVDSHFFADVKRWQRLMRSEQNLEGTWDFNGLGGYVSDIGTWWVVTCHLSSSTTHSLSCLATCEVLGNSLGPRLALTAVGCCVRQQLISIDLSHTGKRHRYARGFSRCST